MFLFEMANTDVTSMCIAYKCACYTVLINFQSLCLKTLCPILHSDHLYIGIEFYTSLHQLLQFVLLQLIALMKILLVFYQIFQ